MAPSPASFLRFSWPATTLLLIGLSFSGCSVFLGGGVTPLAGAARRGDVDLIKDLIRRGASTEEGSGVNNWTPLMHAIHKNQAKAAFALIDAGANPNFTNGDTTPLMMAGGYGQEEIVRGLLKRGADPEHENINGQNALDLALSGVHDIDAWTAGKCQIGTVRAILESAPRLAKHAGFAARTEPVLEACPEMRTILGSL